MGLTLGMRFDEQGRLVPPAGSVSGEVGDDYVEEEFDEA
jgi:hypothetical protein